VIIIGITGRCRSGKTVVAAALEAAAKQRGLTVKRYEFGQLVLDYCIKSGRVPPKCREELNPAELHTLIYTGKQKREEQIDFWVDKMEYEIITDGVSVAILSGVRFPNEARLIREHDGYLIRVVALNANGSQFISPDRDANDPTETELHDVRADYVLTAYRGQVPLLRNYAGVVFRHIKGEIGE